ncbi:MAG: SagB family peptide dehydrogenase [Alphaproteobacteria bacterium]|nr:SagB family peptide dehydrogenase [Alphaproteobacteria bacterium]MBU0796250.1 SagB family peptide dehydrogenase [Alphaproteobacteria bacterium]MBU0885711.1 SagB family peptide dehydrogenase [Alphaproteobacteria bacterium]MBU1813135.1 SagB family peptide dehydrogenase [Alphaproteobacteria bacterium]MBU2090798.1 SagB family peptide dehydrogenase [Alphaproteobacteria bacterium]
MPSDPLLFGYSLAVDIETMARQGDALHLHLAGGRSVTLACPDLRGEKIVERLQAGPASHAALADICSDSMLVRILSQLALNQVLHWHFGPPDRPFCRVESFSGTYCPIYHPAEAAVLRQPLSRFACLRQEQGETILQNAELHARLVFLPGGQDVLAATLADPTPSAWRHFLFCTGFLEPVAAESPARESWEFHDLLFHDATRLFVGERPIGKRDRLKGKHPKPEKIAPPLSQDRIALPPVDTDRASASLRQVMALRRSLREPGEWPLQLADLSTFLGRTLQAQLKPDRPDDRRFRPMPNGGGAHELEFYILIQRCAGLDAGLYQYRESEHALYRLPANAALAKRATLLSAGAMGTEEAPPDCVILMASRLPKIAREYEGIAYRLSLLHAGVAMQSFYLVATDMGLSPCANGSGDSLVFERLTGLPLLQETAIAEFALSGRRVTTPAGPAADSERPPLH